MLKTVLLGNKGLPSTSKFLFELLLLDLLCDCLMQMPVTLNMRYCCLPGT